MCGICGVSVRVCERERGERERGVRGVELETTKEKLRRKQQTDSGVRGVELETTKEKLRRKQQTDSRGRGWAEGRE